MPPCAGPVMKSRERSERDRPHVQPPAPRPPPRGRANARPLLTLRIRLRGHIYQPVLLKCEASPGVQQLAGFGGVLPQQLQEWLGAHVHSFADRPFRWRHETERLQRPARFVRCAVASLTQNARLLP